MLVKSLRVNPSVVFFLIFCALFGWHLSNGSQSHDESIPLPPQDPPPPPDEPVKPKAPRIAVVTFVTDQRSYIHLSLQNKDRKYTKEGPYACSAIDHGQTTRAAMATILLLTMKRIPIGEPHTGSST